MKRKMKAFISWSGGKETSLCCYKIMQNQGVEVSYLLNMVTEDGKFSCSHRIDSDLLRLQVESIGIPLIQRKTTWKTYEEEFKKAILDLEKDGIEAGIFGDIDLQEHRDWVERVCKEMDIKPILPLWKGKREELLNDFINAGFKAIVVVTQADSLGKEWLGREVNKEFIEELKSLDHIDLCGERGEYHTFVYDGPIYKNAVNFIVGGKFLKDRYWFLELKKKIHPYG